MEIGDTKIPDEMLDLANDEFFRAASLNGMPSCTDGQRLGFALAAAARWLRDGILHERNVEFHRAILEAERKRFPGSDQDTAVVMRRVDFEYGVSFARNYLRRMFVSKPVKEENGPEMEVPEEIAYLLAGEGEPIPVRKIYNQRIMEAYLRGRRAVSKDRALPKEPQFGPQP